MKLLWQPTSEQAASTHLAHYVDWLASERGLAFGSYEELWAWSVADIETFWATIWEHFDITASEPYERVLGSRQMPGAQWFPGARLSYVEHIFRDKDDDATAIVHASELRPQAELTWGELRQLTGRIRAGLVEAGVGPGDRVAAYLPNIPEAAAAFFASASLGAIWSSCSPDFGARSVVDRFAQIEPKVLLAVDGYRYGGTDIDRTETIAELQRELPSLEATFVLPYLGAEGNWDSLLRPGGLEFEQHPFEHPLWILYSSGTTGLPKPIVHGQGGILLEHLKKHYLHTDLRAGDRFFWFTTTGWMMWNFLVGALLTDAAIVLYDGSPAAPDLGRLWDLAESAEVTCFGTSAAFIGACAKAEVEPGRGRDLSRLRSVGSTGSPLSPEGFRWVYDQLGDDTWLFSTSGGTDVCTAFVGGVPILPVYEGHLQARALGAAVHAFDEAGVSIVDEVGELVVTEPMPSMPLYFWNDPEGQRYHASYFDVYPGIWRHGDWIEITSAGTAVIHGRSDATINRGGIRIGTSEIYGAVLALDEVVDALAVDVPRPGTSGWLALFVTLREGVTLDDGLVKAVKTAIRRDCSARHLPDAVVQVPDVPRTLSGKILEVPVKRILMGERAAKVAASGTLANPEALQFFVEYARQLAEAPA